MRIVIEIEGDKVISATVEGSTSTGVPPPEILEAARARGAISAGPAPLNLTRAGAAVVAPQEAGASRSKAEAPSASRKVARGTRKRPPGRTARARR
jgi:hypothetical protein